MIELGGKFATSHTRQVTELELVRQSAMRDYHELLGSDTKVVIQNLSLYEPRKSKKSVEHASHQMERADPFATH